MRAVYLPFFFLSNFFVHKAIYKKMPKIRKKALFYTFFEQKMHIFAHFCCFINYIGVQTESLVLI